MPTNANMIQAESAAVSEYREPTQAEEMKKCKLFFNLYFYQKNQNKKKF